MWILDYAFLVSPMAWPVTFAIRNRAPLRAKRYLCLVLRGFFCLFFISSSASFKLSCFCLVSGQSGDNHKLHFTNWLHRPSSFEGIHLWRDNVSSLFHFKTGTLCCFEAFPVNAFVWEADIRYIHAARCEWTTSSPVSQCGSSPTRSFVVAKCQIGFCDWNPFV